MSCVDSIHQAGYTDDVITMPFSKMTDCPPYVDLGNDAKSRIISLNITVLLQTGAGNPLPHAPAFRPVTAPPIVVRQYKEAKSPSPQETECRNSSSTSSQEPASRNEDEE